jgi:hypothetical protein
MKKMLNPDACKKTSLSVLVVTTLGLLLMTTTSATAQQIYQVQDQKITIAGSGKLKDWKPVVNGIDFSGQFLAHEGGVEDLSGFSFGLSLLESAQNTDKYGSIIHQAMNAKKSNEIVFQQDKMMILPIMKMIYLTGTVKLMDGSHLTSMALHYEVENNNRITVKGQQVIWLYELGVNPEDITAYHKDDQITINLEFNLVKEQPVFASNTPKASSPIRPSYTTR